MLGTALFETGELDQAEAALAEGSQAAAAARLPGLQARIRLQLADLWAEADILIPLPLIYAHAGRLADARDAIARARSVHDRSGAKVTSARSRFAAGVVELIAGDAAAAGHHVRPAYEALQAMGERGYLSTVAGRLAEVLCAQGRLDEAQQMTEEARAATSPGDIDAQARWRTGRARILARRGQFPAAQALLDEAETLVSPTS